MAFSTPQPSIALIGAGLAGTAMALGLQAAGYPIAGVASRSPASAKNCVTTLRGEVPVLAAYELVGAAQIILIATPDNAIAGVCAELAQQPGWQPGQIVCHLSGALDNTELEAAARQGAHTLALHPAQTFASPEQGASSLAGAYFTLQGDASALQVGRQMVERLNGHCLTVDKQHKALYHAALCVASNHLVGLAHSAVDMLKAAGIDQSQALPLLLPLMQGTLNNLQQSGLPNALTGPVSRGDVATVEKHLAQLEQHMPHSLNSYLAMASVTQEVAENKGQQSAADAARLRELLQEND